MFHNGSRNARRSVQLGAAVQCTDPLGYPIEPPVCLPGYIHPAGDPCSCAPHLCPEGWEPHSYQNPGGSEHVCVEKLGGGGGGGLPPAQPAGVCKPPYIPHPATPWVCIPHECPEGWEPQSYRNPGGSPHVCIEIPGGPGPGPPLPPPPPPPLASKGSSPWLLVGGVAAVALVGALVAKKSRG